MAEAEQKLTPEQFRLKILEPAKKTDHICWTCKYLKPVIKDSKLPPADIIGWCKKLHWPFYWCIPENLVVKKCIGYERII
uniref:Uncharacterized protein n=1 Tax=Archaeoglobus fulgidus TaxID=2234 RepID=A0A7J2TGX3_ARCFL